MSHGKHKTTKVNDENEHSVESKRLKKVKNCWHLINEKKDPIILQQMGIGMLESDESSGESVVALQQQTQQQNIAKSNDENSNKLDICVSCDSTEIAGVRTKLEPQIDNANFIDPNEMNKFIALNKANAASIEIYTDNKSADRVHKRVSNVVAGTTHSKGRSPLATVSCNNNSNIIGQQQNATPDSSVGDALNAVKRQQQLLQQQHFVPNDEFFLFRLKRQTTPGKNYFEKLSDEMILPIFKWLPKKTLIRCGYVCKRFHQLAQDESLWTRLDLGGKTLRSGALGKILSRGVVILRLAQTEMAHPVFQPNSAEILPEFQSKLQYLDLSMAVITTPSLKMLLSKCRQLKKLSLEHVRLNDDVCDEISKNVNLEALNLAMCEDIESWSIRKLMTELKHLQSLNISWTKMNSESVNALVENISPNILRLNIAGCRKAMFDQHLATLAKRCPGILELDVSDCIALTGEAVQILVELKDLEYLSLSRCYTITASAYMHLTKLRSLLYLDVFGILSDTSLATLQSKLDTVGINKFIHSSVARPTVGTRRTSIWGLRTRD